MLWYGVVWYGMLWYGAVLKKYALVRQHQSGSDAISAKPAVLDETQVYSSYSLASSFGLKLRLTFMYISLCIAGKLGSYNLA